MPADLSQPVRFHLSINVSELGKSVRFFEALFGKKPAKQRSDYAKFELDDPPLVLSLEPHAPAGRGALNHAGFRFPDSAKLVEAQRRLEMAGIHTQREEGVECCYARQTKFWVNDPDGGLWEFYVLEGDIDHRGAGQAIEVVTAVDAPRTRTWEHRLGQPLVVPAESGVGSLDEVRLTGSFNVPVEPDDMLRFLKEVRTALRPGGSLLLHILTAQAPLSSAPRLPGGAGAVKFVPVCGDLLDTLEAAGFADMQLTTFRSRACFEHEGIALRETRIACHRPATSGGEVCTVVYKGPFAEVTDDEGHTWRRGQKTSIPLARWEALQRTPIADQFVELPSETVVGACGT
jgi:catechol 2,3-dioxygenase-like lactoylglutathione lyase family enzyme